MRSIRRTFDNFSCSTILLGKTGENDTSRLEVDVSRILSCYPNAGFDLFFQLPSSIEPYPVAVNVENGKLLYSLDASDLSVPGFGKAEIIVYGSNGEIVKSITAKTKIDKSLTHCNLYPGPIQKWLDFFQSEETQFLELLQEVRAFRDRLASYLPRSEVIKILSTFSIDDEGFLCVDTSTGYAMIDEEGYLCVDVGTVSKINSDGYLEVVA